MANNTQNEQTNKDKGPASTSRADKDKAPAPTPQADKDKAPAPAVQADKDKAPAPTVQADKDKAPAPAVQADKNKAPAPAVQADKNKAPASAVQADKNKAPAPVVQADKDKAPAPAVQADRDKTPASKSQAKKDKATAKSKLDNMIPFNKKGKIQDAKKATADKVAAKKAADKAVEEKARKAVEAAQKVKLEKELREKFNIPKSSKPVEPWVSPEEETVVRLTHEELHSFKGHPFHIDKNTKFLALAASIRARGVTQPAIVRPREAGGFEIISGHRRDAGSIEAGVPYTPCIIRELNDDQAIQQMVEDNVNHRDIGTMELAKALNMQLDSIKHQGAADSLHKGEAISADDVGKRSNHIVAERNNMSIKQVQRHIQLLKLVPDLQEMVDGKQLIVNGKDKVLKIGFTPAVELSAIKEKRLQNYIAVAIEGQQSAPSLSQAQRMRKLAEQKTLTPDVIDGIMTEEKKEVDKVILSTAELSEYFGKEKTPREMKDTIMQLLDEYKERESLDIAPQGRKNTLEK